MVHPTQFMPNFNTKNFSVQEVIQKRANLESLYEWANRKTYTEMPKYVQPSKIPLSAGLVNFLRQVLP